jgi:RNA polymerase sigma-70 factor (ECF subfamily)
VSNKVDVTTLLGEWRAGSQNALATLMPLVYSELHRRASAALRRERPGHLLQPTALVNEVYLRLVDQTRANLATRREFFILAAILMQRILVDHYRSMRAARRPPPELMTSLIEEIPAATRGGTDLIDLDAALSELQGIYPRQAQVVGLRYFVGMSVAETAEILEVSAVTVKRDWRMARAWLSLRLSGGQEGGRRVSDEEDAG